jgi:2-hydroxychromene-2-carboxylate isomerase
LERLSEIGQDKDRAIKAASTDRIGRAHDHNANEARRLNIFGAPTLFTASDFGATTGLRTP